MKKSELIDITSRLSKMPVLEVLKSLITSAYNLNLPVALWRIPNQTELKLIIGFDEQIIANRIDVQDIESGFLFSPFDFPEKDATFIKADIQFSFDYSEVISTLDNESNDKIVQFKTELYSIIDGNKSSKYYSKEFSKKSETDYEGIVSEAIQVIKEGHCEKIVPARTSHEVLPEHFDPIDFFNDLDKAYPNAFISLVSTPRNGTWIGATPEVLIESKKAHFKTVALAGTQKLEPEQSLTDIAWTQKEIEEQAMVSRYIVDCFKKIRLREFKETGPKTVKAGNLAHLKTIFEVDTHQTNFEELDTVMLELLHPTSAVAGMPKEPALRFIKHYESFDRGFYAGFLGPIQNDGNTNLYVNLRCLSLHENEATVYAGAGIVEDSNPEKEYKETEMKFRTLTNILNKKV